MTSKVNVPAKVKQSSLFLLTSDNLRKYYIRIIAAKTLFPLYGTNFFLFFLQSRINLNLLLACFLLKYRLRDIFINLTNDKTNINSNQQKIIGYFLEIITIYYLFTHHHEFFINSRSKDMLFPYPTSILRYQKRVFVWKEFVCLFW